MREPPFLPFLEGPAKVAPHLRPINPESWLLPDTESEAWLAQKRVLMRELRSDVFSQSDFAADAASEAAELVFDAVQKCDACTPFETQLENAASLVSDDLCVMSPVHGQFVLGAASLCAPTFWRLKDKAGKPLGGLHQAVPGGDPQLASRISRIFTGLQPDMILERFNWTVQFGPERFTPDSTPMKHALAEMSPSESAKHLFQRVERQTIRKLPGSGAVLFTIRIVIDPLSPILEDDDCRAAFFGSWKSTDPALRAYKGWPHYDAAIDWLLASY